MDDIIAKTKEFFLVEESCLYLKSLVEKQNNTMNIKNIKKFIGAPILNVQIGI